MATPLLAATGKAYQLGFHSIMIIGLWSAIGISFHWIVPKLRPIAVANQFVTPGDWIRYRFQQQPFSALLRKLAVFCLCLSLANFLFAQFKAAGEIMVVLTDNRIPYHYGVLIFALAVLLYDSFGGMRAVAWTDVFQGMVMLTGLISLTYWLIDNSGGLAHIGTNVTAFRPGSAQIPDGSFQIKWLSLMLLGALSVCVYPQTLQRIFAASTTKTLYRSIGLLGFLSIVTNLVIIFSGWSALSLLTDQQWNIDQVLPLVLKEWASSSLFNYFAASMVLLAVLAAIMSTADSVLLSLVSMVKHDFTSTSVRTDLKQDYRIGLVIVAICSALALYRDITLWRLIELKLELLVQCFPVFVLALHSHSVRASSVITGLIAGLFVLIITISSGIKAIHGINAGLVAVAVNMTCLFLHHVIVCAAKTRTGPIKS